MKQAILFLSLLSFSSVNGQDLILTYNLFTDEITYNLGSKEIDKPYVPAAKNIIVKVIEFNPYTTRATLADMQSDYGQDSATEYAEETGSSLGQLNNMSGLLSGLGLGNSMGQDYEDIPNSRGAIDQKALAIRSRFEASLKKLEDVENKINNYQKQLRLFKNAKASQALAFEDITKLKNNAIIKPSRIKELIQEEIEHAFAKSEGADITIEDLVSTDKSSADARKALRNYNSALEEYRGLQNEWEYLANDVESYQSNTEHTHLEYISDNIEEIVDDIESNIEESDGFDYESMEYEIMDEDESMNSKAGLRRVYEELKSTDFSYSFPPIQATGDKVELNLSFSRISEIGEYEPYKELKQVIPVSGNWKVSGGIGLCFGALDKTRYGYSVREERIVADELDEFIPIITSFMHFYKQAPRSLNFGASFGVGLPILGGSDIQAASFFLGPTIIIGQSNRFLLTGGVMGAKAERLASGFEIGDDFFFFEDGLPTVNRYELGYFIGLSFNVF